MLDADKTVASENKHLVFVSDGVTYLWGNEDGSPYTVFNEIDATGEYRIYAGPDEDEIAKNHEDYDSYMDTLKNINSWMNANNSKFAATIQNYADLADEMSGSSPKTMYNQNSDGTYQKKYVPAGERTEYGYSTDIAMYKTALEYKDIIGSKYNAYVFGGKQQAVAHPWGIKFMEGLTSLGGTYKEYDDNTSYNGMFDNVKSSILYTIEVGEVWDIIGADFDMIKDTFKLTVDSEVLTCTKDSEDENVYNFGIADDDGVYPYAIEYIQADQDGDELFIWTINTPVEKGTALSLSYDLQLVNKATKPGEYETPTNEVAVLYYNSTDEEVDETEGYSNMEYFPVPTVKYSVSENPAPTTPTDTPKTDNATQTSDDFNMTAWMIVMIVAAAGAVAATVRRKAVK